MNLILGLLFLLLLTRLFGHGALRLGLPQSVGELVAGVFLVALFSGLGAIDSAAVESLVELVYLPEIGLVAQAGIFFLVLQAGIEMKPARIAEQSRASFFVALGGALLPLGLGFVAGLFLFPEGEWQIAQAFFLGVVLSITSIPASVRVLQEQGLLTSPFGQMIVAAAIFDDILGLFLLAMLTSLISSGGVPDVASLGLLSAKMGLFFVVTILVGVHVYPRVTERLKTLDLAAVEFSTLLGVSLAYAAFAELMGLHWVMGAFMAGLFFEPERIGRRAYDEMRILVGGVANGVLGPIFFVSIGLALDVEALLQAPWLALFLLVIAFGGKLVGAGLPARLFGHSPYEAAVIGTGMGARGAVELVVISIALNAGLFASGGREIVSALIAVTILSTIASALMLRWLVTRQAGGAAR
ncbi:MAG: cation:proton antiporter [Parvibaculum sp.]